MSDESPDPEIARLLDEYGNACARIGASSMVIDFSANEYVNQRNRTRTAIDVEIARLSRECDELREKVAELEKASLECVACGVIWSAQTAGEPCPESSHVENWPHEWRTQREGKLWERYTELERERDAAVAEAERLMAEVVHLRAAIGRAGYSVMETSGEWSIHDVSELGKLREKQERDTVLQNVDLACRVERQEALLRRCLPYVNHYTSELAADLKAALKGDAT